MTGKKVIDPHREAFRKEADQLLQQIGLLGISHDLKVIAFKSAIDSAKEALVTEAGPIEKELKGLKARLKKISSAERKRKSFDSICLAFGKIIFRKRTALKTLKGITWDKVKELLQEKELTKFLRIKCEVNKDALRDSKMTEEQLADLGVKKVPSRPFGYELDNDKIAGTTDQPAT